MKLEDFAKIEENGRVSATASSSKPNVDGYVITSRDGHPFHVHPEATPDEWKALKKVIRAGEVDITKFSAPVLDAAEMLQRQIVALESTVTPRRIREAVLGVDGGWLQNLNDQIAALRESV